MAQLSNARHERFAQERAKGATADAAYEAAGFKPNRGNAARLNAKESVAARIAELQERGAKRTEMTIASVTERLLSIADKGERAEGAAGLNVARAAVMDAAKLNGLVVDKSEVKAEVEVADARERLARLVAGHAAAAEAGGGASKPH